MPRGLIVACLGVVCLAAACTGGSDPQDDGSPAGPTTGTAAEAATDEDDGGTAVVTEPPVILEVRQRLALRSGECFADAPPTPTTTTLTTVPVVVTDDSGAPVTNAAGSVITEPPSTTLPESEPVAVVDCNGSKAGTVYANGCLGVNRPDAREPVSEIACPGIFEHEFPGSRQLEVAAAVFCLSQFEAVFGEPYALSELLATEWVPTEELWTIGDRRMVCIATSPVEAETQ